VHAGVFFKTQSWRKLRRDRVSIVVEESTRSLCIGSLRRHHKFVPQVVKYREKHLGKRLQKYLRRKSNGGSKFSMENL
jgi:hypothetical protein